MSSFSSNYCSSFFPSSIFHLFYLSLPFSVLFFIFFLLFSSVYHRLFFAFHIYFPTYLLLYINHPRFPHPRFPHHRMKYSHPKPDPLFIFVSLFFFARRNYRFIPPTTTNTKHMCLPYPPLQVLPQLIYPPAHPSIYLPFCSSLTPYTCLHVGLFYQFCKKRQNKNAHKKVQITSQHTDIKSRQSFFLSDIKTQ